MANISGKLNFDLKELAKTTNTNVTHLQLNSEKDASLILSEDDPFIKSIVEYISKGAGDIKVRIRGLRTRVHTAKGVAHLSINEVQLEEAAPDALVKIFTEMSK